MAEYEHALRLIEPHRDDADFEAQPESRVRRAEQALGVTFPPTYRRFLLELGAGSVGGEQIYGLVNDDFDDIRPPQAIGLTRKLRADGRIDDRVVAIYGVGDGTYFGLQISDGDAEVPVVAFTPGADRAGDELEIVAPDFGTFLLEIIREDLADDG